MAGQFDPAKAREAVETFAEAMRGIEAEHPEAVQALRNSWNATYLDCGHKALGRYLLTGDVDRACKSFER